MLLVDPSPRGGIAAYTALVARALSEAGVAVEILGSAQAGLHAEGIRVVSGLPIGVWGKPENAGVRFYWLRVKTWMLSAGAVLGQVVRTRPDVVHFQAPLNRRFDRYLIELLARFAPVVWTAHDVLPFEPTMGDAKWFAGIYRSAARVIVHSEPAAEQLGELAGVRAVVIDHPVPDGLTETPQAEARRLLSLPSEGRILAAVGFIRPYKGYRLLADAWEQLGDRAPLLLVVGEVLDESEAHTLERLTGSGRADLRLGYAEDGDLQLAIRASDAVLLPYLTASDSGIVHLARGLGVPVVGSDAPQLAATICATGAGRVVPRTVEAWKEAVVGELPDAPPRPPPLRETGLAHLGVYREVVSPNQPGLRVALYSDASEIGGAEHALASLLAALPAEYQLTVIGVDGATVEWLAAHRAGTATLVLPSVRDKRDLGAILAHVRAVRRLRPDVLHVNLRHPWSCQYGILGGLLAGGTRVVAVEHAPIGASGWLQRRLRQALSSRLAAHVAVGERSARRIETLIGRPPRSIRTVYNGLDPSLPESPPRPFAEPTIGFVGRLSREKGLDVLLRALPRVPESRLVVVGDGRERHALETLVEELGLGERVRFTGWRADARALVGTLDVLAVPSRFESLPMVVLEAMFAGVPVVASDVGSIPEAVEDGVTGRLVTPGDVDALSAALAELLADEGLRGQMGARAREAANRRFSVQATAAAFSSLYEEIAS